MRVQKCRGAIFAIQVVCFLMQFMIIFMPSNLISVLFGSNEIFRNVSDKSKSFFERPFFVSCSSTVEIFYHKALAVA